MRSRAGTHIQTNILTQARTYAFTHKDAETDRQLHPSTLRCTQAHRHTDTHTDRQTHTHAHTHTHTHTRARARARAHARTHTHTRFILMICVASCNCENPAVPSSGTSVTQWLDVRRARGSRHGDRLQLSSVQSHQSLKQWFSLGCRARRLALQFQRKDWWGRRQSW